MEAVTSSQSNKKGWKFFNRNAASCRAMSPTETLG